MTALALLAGTAIVMLVWMLRSANTNSSQKGYRDFTDRSSSITAASFLRSGSSSSLAHSSPDGSLKVCAVEGSVGESGTVALQRGEQILWEITLPRPNNPSVSNNGTVTVENWGPPDSTTLESRFLIFDVEGEPLLDRHFDANAYDSGISPDGTLAWLTTANAGSDDGSRLFVYDIAARKRILKTELLMRGVEHVERSENGLLVKIEGLICRYEDGTLVESDDFDWAREEQMFDHARSPNSVADAAKSRLERANELSDEQLRATIDRVDQFDGQGTDRAWARLYRRRGELYHYLGEDKNALADYEKALSLNEKVGVKRKTKKLRQSLT